MTAANPRTDADVERDVREEIFWDGRIEADDVAVAVRDGTVTLRGTVGSFGEKRAAEYATRRVVGVVAVDNRLDVRLLIRHARADAELRGRVLQVLAWNSFVPDTVDARVEQGMVTLEGTAQHRFQRDEAERAVMNLAGVRSVFDEIEVDGVGTVAEVQERIERAFRRNSALEASEIRVAARGGKVTLHGSVRSLAEHDAALDAAWAAPGVRTVVDRLEVA